MHGAAHYEGKVGLVAALCGGGEEGPVGTQLMLTAQHALR
jgi:hypothetical protein